MLLPSIKSRPVYGTLAPRAGTAHLFVADAEGAEAILDLAGIASPDFFEKAQIFYVPTRGAAGDFETRLTALRPHAYNASPSIAAMLPRLSQTLSTARMGLQLYLAGTEGLIGRATKVATEYGIHHDAIMTEHRGSMARRVQCVHCKGITEEVVQHLGHRRAFPLNLVADLLPQVFAWARSVDPTQPLTSAVWQGEWPDADQLVVTALADALSQQWN